MNSDNNTKVSFKTPVGTISEVDMLDPADVHTINIKDYKPTNIRWNMPVVLTMEDDNGKLHEYNLIEILDGLTRLARRNKNA